MELDPRYSIFDLKKKKIIKKKNDVNFVVKLPRQRTLVPHLKHFPGSEWSENRCTPRGHGVLQDSERIKRLQQ